MQTKIYRGYLDYDDIDEFLEDKDQLEGVVQAFDPRFVASTDHLRSAAEKAVRSTNRGENVAESIDMEILLYAAGTRQIDDALEIAVSPPCEAVMTVTAEPGETACREVESVLEDAREIEEHSGNWSDIVRYFDIPEEEIGSVGSHKLETLVLERVALLDIDK